MLKNLDFSVIGLRLSILAIASFNTFASVIGLGSLFSATAIPVMAVGVALELGKYSAVGYLFKHWSAITRNNKLVIAFFTFWLMLFTSAGVFSYLGQSFQTANTNVAKNALTLQQTVAEKEHVTKRIAEINTQITNLPNTSVNGRIKLMNQFKAEQTQLQTRLSDLIKAESSLSQTAIDASVHAGPISFISRMANVTNDVAAIWVVGLLTLCLDPFAIFLTAILGKYQNVKKSESTIDDTLANVEASLEEQLIETQHTPNIADEPETNEQTNSTKHIEDLTNKYTNRNLGVINSEYVEQSVEKQADIKTEQTKEEIIDEGLTKTDIAKDSQDWSSYRYGTDENWDDETALLVDNKQVQVPIIQNHVGFIRNPTLKVRVRV